MSRAPRVMQRDISKVFYKVWHASLLHKQTSGWVFGLISSLPHNRWLRVVLDGKSSQEYSVNAGVAQLLKALFLILRFSYYTLTTFRMMVCVIYFIWDKVFKNGPKKNLWKTAFKKFYLVHSWILCLICWWYCTLHSNFDLALCWWYYTLHSNFDLAPDL